LPVKKATSGRLRQEEEEHGRAKKRQRKKKARKFKGKHTSSAGPVKRKGGKTIGAYGYANNKRRPTSVSKQTIAH